MNQVNTHVERATVDLVGHLEHGFVESAVHAEVVTKVLVVTGERRVDLVGVVAADTSGHGATEDAWDARVGAADRDLVSDGCGEKDGASQLNAPHELERNRLMTHGYRQRRWKGSRGTARDRD